MKKESRNYRKIYAALMLIKDMYEKKLISDIVYKNILDDYSKELDLSDFMD